MEGPDDHRGWRCASDDPVHYQRTLANGWDSFKPPNDVTEGNLYAQWGRRYVLNLRPGEYYTRYFHPLARRRAGTFRPVSGKDMDANRNLRANGLWRYAPDLRNPATRALVYSESGRELDRRWASKAPARWCSKSPPPMWSPRPGWRCVRPALGGLGVARCRHHLEEAADALRGSGVPWRRSRALTEYLVKVELAARRPPVLARSSRRSRSSTVPRCRGCRAARTASRSGWGRRLRRSSSSPRSWPAITSETVHAEKGSM